MKRSLCASIGAAVGGLFLFTSCHAAWAADVGKEIATAAQHAGFAGHAPVIWMVRAHLHHTINCLVGPQGNGFDAKELNPCKDYGNGAIPDTEDATKVKSLRAALGLAEEALKSDDLDTAKTLAAQAAAEIKKLVEPSTTKPAPPPAVTGQPEGTMTKGSIFQDCPYCPQMVKVPLGSFQMGSRGEDSTEQPWHEVSIERRFAIGVFEVTYGEWMACVKDKGCKYAPELPSATDRSPMRNVSWSDAVGYTEWLRKATGRPYRLPTEAEWEYAARANTSTRYWWGNDPGIVDANCRGCGGEWNREAPAQTGSFPPNSFGIYDMNGSVWEWVSDCWHHSYKGAPNDGSSWESPGCQQRVLRGGSWRDDPRLVRSSSRFYYDADIPYIANGFRVALSLD